MGFEIFEGSIPLEVGLRDTISIFKGCYIGQEIITRTEKAWSGCDLVTETSKRVFNVELVLPLAA
jgi:hypothetical protein